MALEEAGFSDINDLNQPSPCYGIYTMSQRIEDGLNPYSNNTPISLKIRTEMFLQVC